MHPLHAMYLVHVSIGSAENGKHTLSCDQNSKDANGPKTQNKLAFKTHR